MTQNESQLGVIISAQFSHYRFFFFEYSNEHHVSFSSLEMCTYVCPFSIILERIFVKTKPIRFHVFHYSVVVIRTSFCVKYVCALGLLN